MVQKTSQIDLLTLKNELLSKIDKKADLVYLKSEVERLENLIIDHKQMLFKTDNQVKQQEREIQELRQLFKNLQQAI